MTTDLQTARDRLDLIRVQAETAKLEAELAAYDTLRRWVPEAASYPEIVDRTESLTLDGVDRNGVRISQASDRKDGDNAPWWTSEYELAMIRGSARVVADAEEIAQAALDSLVNYSIGPDGFDYRFAAKDSSDEEAKVWAAQAQAIADRFIEMNDWSVDGEQETCRNAHRDGEWFLGLIDRGGGNVELRHIDPDWVSEPTDTATLEDYLGIPRWNWKYGIATDFGNTRRVHGAFVTYDGDVNDWDFFPSARLVHVRHNVDGHIKRGMSDFFSVATRIRDSSRLLENTIKGASIQATIAYVREHAPGLSGQDVQDIVDAQTTKREARLAGRTERFVDDTRPGQIHDVTGQTKYYPGPVAAGQGHQIYVSAMQAGLRIAGTRWTMPEYMVSGDASNGNFASTLVAEAPFTISAKNRQGRKVRKYRELIWKVVMMGQERLGATLQQIKDRVELNVKPPAFETRNRLEEHTLRQNQYNQGFLSLQTWSAEENRDLEAEQQLGARRRPESLGPPTTIPPVNGPTAPTIPSSGDPVPESIGGVIWDQIR